MFQSLKLKSLKGMPEWSLILVESLIPGFKNYERQGH